MYNVDNENSTLSFSGSNGRNASKDGVFADVYLVHCLDTIRGNECLDHVLGRSRAHSDPGHCTYVMLQNQCWNQCYAIWITVSLSNETNMSNMI